MSPILEGCFLVEELMVVRKLHDVLSALGGSLTFPLFLLQVTSVPTSPIDGQKTGTSGLRKKVTRVQQRGLTWNSCTDWKWTAFLLLDRASMIVPGLIERVCICAV